MAAWPALPADLTRKVAITLLRQRGEEQLDLQDAFQEARLYLRPKAISKSVQGCWTTPDGNERHIVFVGMRGQPMEDARRDSSTIKLNANYAIRC